MEVYCIANPQSCVLGLTDSSQIYMVDFGLAKTFRDSSGKHMHYAESKNLVGTVRYMSINAHRDDRMMGSSVKLIRFEQDFIKFGKICNC